MNSPRICFPPIFAFQELITKPTFCGTIVHVVLRLLIPGSRLSFLFQYFVPESPHQIAFPPNHKYRQEKRKREKRKGGEQNQNNRRTK
ncbi:hypothetical protein VTL71DRAFT_14799 [Oculimacula yallundae]|uniref:Uncharacterized protein n=1 Tax=Oculimacula yallundae TaxID=86028 RepID=A0ABR4CJH7_9HELO